MKTLLTSQAFAIPSGSLPWRRGGASYLIDTTLRDGEQAPGVVFSLNEKISIAQMLHSLGIEELEIGSPFISERDVRNIKILLQQGFRFRASCWARARCSDVDAAAKTGAAGINISFPVSDIQLFALQKNRNWVLDELPKIVEYARKKFDYVSVGAQDASRTDIDFLALYVKQAEQAGAYRVRIADTVGCLNPFSTYTLIANVIAALDTDSMEIEFHGHNDLGMATANSLAAIHAGANCVSGTINGLGERAGNAALEEVIMALRLSMGQPDAYNTAMIYELCQFVALASGRNIAPMKPVIGEMAHKHETGIHTNSLLRNKRTYQLFDAEDVGKKGMDFMFGIHSGSAAIQKLLCENNITVNKNEALKISEIVKNEAYKKKCNLTENEVIHISKSILDNAIA